MIDLVYLDSIAKSLVVLFIISNTVGIVLGIYLSRRDTIRSLRNVQGIKNTLEDILNTIKNMEEHKMTTEALTNELTLTDLIEQEPTEENYEEVVGLLTELANRTYKDYKFLIAKSKDETKEANFLQIVSNWNEQPTLHKLIFSKSIDYGIDMQELQKRVANEIADNNLIELGEGVKVIVDDGTGQLPTGVSPINSGLEGGEIAFIISFVHKNNYKEFMENAFPKKEEE